MLSQNEQEKIHKMSGRLAALFEDLHNMHRKENANEVDMVNLVDNLLDMFSEQECNLSVDLFKNIYNRV